MTTNSYTDASDNGRTNGTQYRQFRDRPRTSDKVPLFGEQLVSLDSATSSVAYLIPLSTLIPFNACIIFPSSTSSLYGRWNHLRSLFDFLIYHGLLGILIYSLWVCSRRDPGIVEEEFTLRSLELALASAKSRDEEGGDGLDEDDLPLSQLKQTQFPHPSQAHSNPQPQTQPQPQFHTQTQTLTSKQTTGKPRECRKCLIAVPPHLLPMITEDRIVDIRIHDGREIVFIPQLKPDRTHHCGQCGRCVLKMDHHCHWLSTCIGYRNSKPFYLFLFYSTLLSLFVGVESFLATWQVWILDSSQGGNAEDLVGLRSVGLLVLVFLGGLFGLMMGGFGGFHCWLISQNVTTLENMTFTPSPALLPLPSPSSNTNTTIESTRSYPPTENHRPSLVLPRDPSLPPQWKPDHLLSRAERYKTRKMSEVRLYDLGWRRNFEVVFDHVGERGKFRTRITDDTDVEDRRRREQQEEDERLLEGDVESGLRRQNVSDYGEGQESIGKWKRRLLWFWPGTEIHGHLAGHSFPYSPTALAELQERTAEVRLR